MQIRPNWSRLFTAEYAAQKSLSQFSSNHLSFFAEYAAQKMNQAGSQKQYGYTQNIAANSAHALATIEKRDFFVEPPRMGLRRVARAQVLQHSTVQQSNKKPRIIFWAF